MNPLKRKNKFKVWDGRQMYLPPIILSDNDVKARVVIDDGICLLFPHGCEDQTYVRVSELTELQYIGYKDAEDTEIYETDLVEYKGKVFAVLWNPFCCAFNFFTINDNSLKPLGLIWYAYQKEMKKVGNLLEDKNYTELISTQKIHYYNGTLPIQ